MLTTLYTDYVTRPFSRHHKDKQKKRSGNMGLTLHNGGITMGEDIKKGTPLPFNIHLPEGGSGQTQP